MVCEIIRTAAGTDQNHAVTVSMGACLAFIYVLRQLCGIRAVNTGAETPDLLRIGMSALSSETGEG